MQIEVNEEEVNGKISELEEIRLEIAYAGSELIVGEHMLKNIIC